MTDAFNPATSALLGIAVGDALGVPYEFTSRHTLSLQPAEDMRGYGTHHQPPGTWSDDSSLTFCLAESLTQGYNLRTIAESFLKWRMQNYWTALGEVFDIGATTSSALHRLERILSQGDPYALHSLKSLTDEQSNGNGSLMRIMPLIFAIGHLPEDEQFHKVWEVSALTHTHLRAGMACYIYLKIAQNLIKGQHKHDAYHQALATCQQTFADTEVPKRELTIFEKVMSGEIQRLPQDQIKSSGYVIDSLEASLWCFLNAENYRETVLSAVNLGDDTDTIAAISGGLAGLYHGAQDIPLDWLKQLARLNDITQLGYQLWIAHQGQAP